MKRRRPLGARCEQLGLCRIDKPACLFRRSAALRRNFFHRELAMQHVLRRIVVHVAEFADVPVARGHRQLVRVQNGARLIERPRKVVAVVVEIDIRILRSIEAAALAIGHHRIEPRNNLLGCLAEIRPHEALVAVHIVAQQLGVVVEHLFEVRHHPALIHAVAMEASGELVVHAAARHPLQGDGESLPAPLHCRD